MFPLLFSNVFVFVFCGVSSKCDLQNELKACKLNLENELKQAQCAHDENMHKHKENEVKK